MLTAYTGDGLVAYCANHFFDMVNDAVRFQFCVAEFTYAHRLQLNDVLIQGPKQYDGHSVEHLKWDGQLVVRTDRVKNTTISFATSQFPGWNIPGYLITGPRGSASVMHIFDVDKDEDLALPDVTLYFSKYQYHYTSILIEFRVQPDGRRTISLSYMRSRSDISKPPTAYHRTKITYRSRNHALHHGSIVLGTTSLSGALPEGVSLSCSEHEAQEIASYAFYPYLPDWDKGDLCQICADGSKAIDINTVMYMKEMMEMAKMVKSTLELFKGKPNPKKLASAYLSYTYGYRLSYKDTVELYNVCKAEAARERRSSAISRARKSNQIKGYHDVDITYTGTAGLNYSPYPYLEGQILNDMFRWDVFPTLSNLYDWIPWSFVVDWFFPIGPALDAIDYRTYMQTLTVNYVVYGQKWEIAQIPWHDIYLYLPWWSSYFQPIGPISCSFYHRYYEREATPPKIESDFPTSFNHWVEGSALLIQKVSK